MVSTSNSAKSLIPTSTDVLVVGAGPVGLSFALLLAQGDPTLSITVVDSKPAPAPWSPASPWDIRSSAITRSSENIWRRLGVWPALVSKRMAAYEHMTVMDAQSFGEFTFKASDVSEPNLGRIVENQVLNSSLWTLAAQTPNIHLCPAFHATALHWHSDQVSIESPRGNIQAQLLVGADGPHSWVREQAGIACESQSYGQAAIITTVKSSESHRHTAWQRFLTSGPLAFLPLADPQVSSIVWTQDLAWAEQWCQQASLKTQSADLEHASDRRFGHLELLNPPQCYPLKNQQARQYVKPRLALIGDAAHVIHPLAGQGLNLGIQDAEALAQVLQHPRTLQEQDLGNFLMLKRYEHKRKFKNQFTLKNMSLINQGFLNNNSIIRSLRGWGMNQIHHCLPLKQFFIRQGLGL